MYTPSTDCLRPVFFFKILLFFVWCFLFTRFCSQKHSYKLYTFATHPRLVFILFFFYVCVLWAHPPRRKVMRPLVSWVRVFRHVFIVLPSRFIYTFFCLLFFSWKFFMYQNGFWQECFFSLCKFYKHSSSFCAIRNSYSFISFLFVYCPFILLLFVLLLCII